MYCACISLLPQPRRGTGASWLCWAVMANSSGCARQPMGGRLAAGVAGSDGILGRSGSDVPYAPPVWDARSTEGNVLQRAALPFPHAQAFCA